MKPVNKINLKEIKQCKIENLPMKQKYCETSKPKLNLKVIF